MKNLSEIGFDKYCACPSGRIYSLRSGRYLRQVVQANGYCQVTLCQDGKRSNFLVHRLIAIAFIPNPQDKPTVNHINGNKQDNSLVNLEWMTQQEQVHHSILTGLRYGTRNPDRSLDDEKAHQVCKLIADSWRNKDIAEAIGIDQQIVANIRYGKDYQEIACEYDFNNILPSRRKISVEKLTRICELLEKGKSYREIRLEVDVSSAAISKIKNRKHGIYISQSFNF